VGWSQLVDATPSDLDHFLEVVLMRQGRRYGLSAEQKADIWRRWKAGESLHEIGRDFGKDHGSIQFLLSQHGGIVPAVRRRSPRALTLAEREDISRGIASGSSIREIARGLQWAASTVSREVVRHGGRPLYRANEADQQAWKLALRPKACLLANHRKLRTIVASKLILDWSPEQISGWLRRRYPSNESMRVSHETIYRSLFIQARGVLKKELMQHLRSKRSIRRSVHSRAGGQSRGQIVDAISISERPAEIEDRAIPGHWEGDLLSGTGNSHIATLVERHSRFTILVKVPSKDTATVVDALTRQVGDGHKSSFLKGEQRENDAGGQPPFKYPMGLARKRIEAGGWTRQVTIRDFPLSKKMAGVQMRLIGSGVRELHWPVGSEWAASSMFPNTRRLLDIRLPTDSLLGSSDKSATARIAQSPLDPRGHVRRDHQAKDAHQRKSRSLCTAPVNPGITKSRLMLRGEPSCSATPFPSSCTK
jgi:IS30 family transposase